MTGELSRGDPVGGPAQGAGGIPDRCAPSAERRGDARYGTAAPVPRWFLIEQAGAWGREALLESEVDGRVAAALAAAAAAVGTRVVLIRRPGRLATGAARRWAVVDSRAGHERVGWGSWRRAEDLLDVPLDEPVGDGGGPVYLVCAHGRHDACCAIRGRPVAEALARLRPEQTWECSHIGGDHFAANLVALPHGLYYGHVTATSVADLVAALRARGGRPDLAARPVRVRGARAGRPAPRPAGARRDRPGRAAPGRHGPAGPAELAGPARRARRWPPARHRPGRCRPGGAADLLVACRGAAPHLGAGRARAGGAPLTAPRRRLGPRRGPDGRRAD